MAAIRTLNSHVKRAVEFFNKDDIYFAIGKSSPWEDVTRPEIDDTNPPAPAFETDSLEEVIGYKKVESIHLVVPDEAGEISYRDSRWRVIPANTAYSEECRYVYLSTTIRYDELPLGKYRQVGVFSGLVPAANVPAGQFNLLPSEVLDEGTLEIVDNRRDNNRQLDQKETLNLIIKM